MWGMQTLADYLKGKKKAEFARQLGISSSQLSQYLSGYRRPRFEQMLKIAIASGGAVPIESWAPTRNAFVTSAEDAA
jgi:transcriptional regulator with XRE-family HTH domain